MLSDSQIKETEVFLVMTAIEAGWDKEKYLVFLGEGCRLYSRKETWSALAHEVFACELTPENQDMDDAYNYVGAFYEEALIVLAKILNSIHRVNYSIRYWRITIGPWLFHFIHIFYSRYYAITKFIENYPHFSTFVLDQSQFVIPQDTVELMYLVQDDVYNWQLYSQILTELGYSFPAKSFIMGQMPQSCNEARSILEKISAQMTVSGTQEKPIDKTVGQFSAEIDECQRALLKDIFRDEKDEFQRIFFKTFPQYIPLLFMEQYPKMLDRVAVKYCNQQPAEIRSETAWYWDEDFKFWAASCAESGTKLIGSPHGGDYGVVKHMFQLDHEIAITDQMTSLRINIEDKFPIKILSNFRFSFLSSIKFKLSNSEHSILLVSNTWLRYIYRLQSFPSYSTYLKQQESFLLGLDKNVRRKIKVRLRNNDLGWDNRARLLDIDSTLTFSLEDEKPLWQEIMSHRLIIIDYLGTTYLQALRANKPTILIWNAEHYGIIKSEQVYFQMLIDAGILYRDPHEAATMVNRIHEDPKRWWKSSNVQKARKDFCSHFGSVNQINKLAK